MAAPTNISFLTATDLTSLPQTITQVADFGGTTYDLYFHIPASLITSIINELGIFGLGDLAVYTPSTTFYLGPAASPTQVVRINTPIGLNVPIQVPVDEGDEYFIKVATNGGNPSPANLTLLVQAANNINAQGGDIVIPDDTSGFPCCILNGGVDYTIRKFVHPYSSSEQGDILHVSGVQLMHIEPGSAFIDKLAFFNRDFSLNSIKSFSPAIGNTSPAIRANQTTQHLWVLYVNDPALYAFYFDSDGVASAVENLGNPSIHSAVVGTNPTETIIYYSDGFDIQKWDLVNHIALPDFAAGIANYDTVDILTLSNGELIVGYWKATATRNFLVKHYSAAGAVLHTYDYGSDVNDGSACRLAYSLDNLTSFYVYIARPSSGANRGKSVVFKTRISDGVALITRNEAQFNQGEYDGAATLTPFADFGISSSCPFFVVAGVATSGLYTVSGTGAIEAAKVTAGEGTGVALIRHDQNWTDVAAGLSENVKIPDPYYDTFLAGDE